jgi:hypothetical protein
LKLNIKNERWAGTLLFALMGYNSKNNLYFSNGIILDPFFSIELMVKGAFPVFLNRLLYMSFVVILLLYWLIAFDAVRTVIFLIFYFNDILNRKLKIERKHFICQK